MGSTLPPPSIYRPRHPWLRKIHVAFQLGSTDPFLEDVVSGLQGQARLQGHTVQTTPDDQTDVILTTAPFGASIGWRESLLLTGRQGFNLKHMPVVYTLIHASLSEFHRRLDYFEAVLAKDPLDPAGYEFDGLAPQA